MLYTQAFPLNRYVRVTYSFWCPISVTRSLNQLSSNMVYTISFATIPVAIASIPSMYGVSANITDKNVKVPNAIPQPTIFAPSHAVTTVSYTHLRAHETGRNLVCRLLLEKKKDMTLNA